MNELFLKIINMSISASWLILAVLILRLVLKKAPKWVNVLLWGIVAVRLICPLSFESALSLIPSSETIPLDIEMAAKPTIDSGVPAINSVVNPVLSSFAPPQHVLTSANPLQIWIPILNIIWLIGVGALLLYTAVSYWRLCRKVDTAVRYKGNIFQSENVSSPFVLGIIKPRIYLPFNMNGQDLEHVVAHEQAHIRRKDHWWKPLGFLLLTIHWFNPFVWAAYILFCSDLELACDESAVKKLNPQERKDYSYALLSCSIQRRLVTVCPLAFGEVGVKKRVKEILNYKKPTFWVVLAAVAVCVIVAVCFLTNPKQGTTTTILLTNETGKSENGVDAGNVASADEVNAQQETDTALQEALDKQRERAEAVKEASAAEQEKQAAENPAGWVPMQQNGNTTTWMNMQDGATAGFVTGKGDAAYAQVKLGDTTLLLLSDGIYQDGEHTYAMYCDVYGVGEDGTPVQIGELLSEGTAYPICVGMSGFYVTSGHSIEVYNLDTATGQLVLTGSNTENFDENGNETYYRLDSRGQSVESTEEEYLQAWDAYGKDAQPIEFTTP